MKEPCEYILTLIAVIACANAPVRAQELEGALKRIQQTKTIRLGYHESSVPFSYRDANKQPAGFTVDICSRVANGIQQQLALDKLDVKWVLVTELNRFEMVRDGAVDVECGTSTNTLTRQKMVDFSLTIWLDGANFVVDPARSGARKLGDLGGKKIGVVDNTTTNQVLADTLKRDYISAEIVPVDDYVAGLNALKAGKIDAFAADQAVLIGLAAAVRNQFRLLLGEQNFSYEPFALTVRRNDPDFRLAVNTVVARVLRSGQIAEIYQRWFGSLGKPSPLLVATWASNSLPD
jgi:ABC-type amino acid transport substrate-binding protein